MEKNTLVQLMKDINMLPFMDNSISIGIKNILIKHFGIEFKDKVSVTSVLRHESGIVFIIVPLFDTIGKCTFTSQLKYTLYSIDNYFTVHHAYAQVYNSIEDIDKDGRFVIVADTLDEYYSLKKDEKIKGLLDR